MSSLNLYWLLKLDDVRNVLENIAIPLIVFGIVGIILFVVSSFLERYYNTIEKCRFPSIESIENYRAVGNVWLKAKSIGKIFMCVLLPLGTMFGLTQSFLPSTKQMAVIIVVPKIINSQGVQELPKRIVGLCNEWLEELRPENIKDVAKEEEIKK